MSNESELQIPERMLSLPRDKHGRPVPWFVAFINDPDDPTKGDWDFRIAEPEKLRDAVRWDLCVVCGKLQDSHAAFVIGPMCAVNRTASEPPAHPECATYSARACPFLSTPNMTRRERHLPEHMLAPPGIMIPRNPGVALVWVSRNWSTYPDPNGATLFDIGDPDQVHWYARGRAATRDEVLASIESGVPILQRIAALDGPSGLRQLNRDIARALELVPAS